MNTQLAIKYFTVLNDYKQYSYELSKLILSNKDLITDDVIDVVYPQVFYFAQNLKFDNNTDYSKAEKYMTLVSNMLEYFEFDSIKNNVTGVWNASGAASA